MSDKPSYLGLLNAIAVAEGRAHSYLRAWIDVSPSAEVRQVLRTVAAREGEHAMSFAKRINELGYEFRPGSQDDVDKAMKIAASSKTDLEKMRAFKLHRIDTGTKPDIFDEFFKDHSIDVRTGELLGRYVAEERDSGRLLRSCYEQLKHAASGTPAGDDTAARLEDKVDALCRAVEELRQIVCAQTMPTT